MTNLIFEIANGIGIVRVDRPEALNALNREAVEELDELLEKIQRERQVAVLIVGSGDHFAAGADIKGMADLSEEEVKGLPYSDTFSKLAKLEIPTIAAMEGFALGGGLELALACDLRIASRTAKMGFPEIKLGIMPGAGGTVRGPRIIGEARTKELIFLGETIGADQAERIGLVNRVVEPEALMDSALEWAGKLCSRSPLALSVAKATIHGAMDESEIDKAIRTEHKNWAGLFGTEDQKEGMKAFIEKRAPVYSKGK